VLVIYGENDYQSSHFHKLVGHSFPVMDYSDELIWVICSKFIPFGKKTHVYRYYSDVKFDYYKVSQLYEPTLAISTRYNAMLPSIDKDSDIFSNGLSTDIDGTHFELLTKYFDWAHIPAKTYKSTLDIEIIHEVSAEERE
jgi:hypothetical protein